ncbi:MAG: hypothetical protein JF606_17160 [Burkholderiales bacterium]|nr:hypothetical protein [Burkholderiales bacterium]
MLKFLGTLSGIVRPGKAVSTNPASGTKISEPAARPSWSVGLAPRIGQLDAPMRPHAALPALSREPSQHGEIRECNPTPRELLADERRQDDALLAQQRAQRAQLVHSALPTGGAVMKRLKDRTARAHPTTRAEQWRACLNGRPKPLDGERMQAFGAMLHADVMALAETGKMERWMAAATMGEAVLDGILGQGIRPEDRQLLLDALGEMAMQVDRPLSSSHPDPEPSLEGQTQGSRSATLGCIPALSRRSRNPRGTPPLTPSPAQIFLPAPTNASPEGLSSSRRPVPPARVASSELVSPREAIRTEPQIAPEAEPKDQLLKCLIEGSTHPMIVVASGQLTNARRAMQKALDEAGRPFVYADSAMMLRDLEHDVRIEHGKPRRADGPFRQLLHTGGTLLLNLTTDDGCPRFTPRQLESLNTLMEEQIWDGRPIPCREMGERVKIAFLVDENTSLTQIASGALASRVSLSDFKACTFANAPDPVIHPAASPSAAALVIDLQDDSRSWQRILFGGPELTLAQTWQHGPGAVEGFDFSCQSLVLRNPPADPLLMDQVSAWLAKHPGSVRLEHGLPADEAAERTARKHPAADFSLALQTRPETVCTLHQANFHEVFHGGYGAKNNALARLPAMLSQAQAKAGEHLPIIFVSEPLTPAMWDRLMHHPGDFEVAVAPDVHVDTRYAGRVATTRGMPCDAALAIDDLSQPGVWSAPVTFLHCADPTLIDPSLPRDCTRIHVTPTTSSDELLYSLQRQPAADPQGLPALQVRTHQLVEDLKAGKSVVLHGLETNPELVRDLAPLLHPPHALTINGERLAFSGRLLVVSPDRRVVEHHGLTPALRDPTPTRDAWRQAATNRLSVALAVPAVEARELIAPVLEWFETLQRAGIAPASERQVRYATVQTLCSTLLKLRTSAPSLDPEEARLVRSLLKDMLIGDHRRPEQVHDTRYAQLKACLKVLLPGEMSEMPARSMDLSRLKSLLAEVRHPEDIKALAWPFLNAFSPDVIEQVIGTTASAVSADAQASIAAKVLDLVCAQARAHDIALPALVAQRPHGPSPVQVSQTCARPAPLQRDQKLAGKVAQAPAQGIFLKGPPGTGKTHLVQTLSQGREVFWASVADEGTAAFRQQLQAWAASRPPGTLVVDEANLARPGNLAMLKGVFADRSLHVNGVLHKLEADHRIIFTGNADSLPGRSPQPVAQESFATVQFKSMHSDFLRKAFVEPVLESSLRLGLGPEVAEVGAQVLQIHERLQRVPEAGLSPRDLEECLARALGELQTHRARGSGLGAQDLAPVLARVALQVYGDSLPQGSLPMVEVWLRHQLQVPPGEALPELFDAQAVGAALQEQQLAPTKSTIALAGAVDGWLRSQGLREAFNPKNDTLGKRALLIEGPASRGKDAVVKAMLLAQGKREGIDFVHINANPNDLDGLRAAVSNARRRGQVVLVSELNLLSSGILEGEFNTLLTGQTGEPAAAGFALIATVNAGYAGRETFSSALQNRMQMLKLQDYEPEEILPIAQARAANLAAQRSAASAFTSKAGSSAADSSVPESKVRQLVDRHIDLLGKLKGQASEFTPGVRQLRDALALLAKRPMMTVDEAFAGPYGFYCSLAAQSAVLPAKAPIARDEQIARQLSIALRLAYPRMCQPALRGDPTLWATAPVAYDAKRHELRFLPKGQPEELIRFMLEEAGSDRLFIGRLTDDPRSVERSTADVAVSRAPSTSTAPARRRNFSMRRRAAAPAGGGGLVAAGGALVPSFRPRSPSSFRSGVGSPSSTGDLGSVINLGPEDGNLTVSRLTLDGLDWTWPVRHENNTPDYAGPLVELRTTQIDRVDGEGRVYLPVPGNRRPTEVRLNKHKPEKVHRDERGSWYVLTQADRQFVKSVTYKLVNDRSEDDAADNTPLGLPPDFPALADAFMPTLAEEIRSLYTRRARVGMNSVEVAKELATIFQTTLSYSDDDADALNQTSSIGERCRRFLSVGQGVCYEFATACAAVLMQSFEIEARLCCGHMVDRHTNKIELEGHTWVEVKGTEGRWHVVDPTPPEFGDSVGQVSAVRGAGRVQRARNRRAESATRKERIPAWDGPNLFDETFDAELLEGISLDELGLSRGKLQRGAAQYHPTTGVLDLKRVVAGEPDMFRRPALTETAEVCTLVIEDLPPSGSTDSAAWPRFWNLMARPLAALQRKGVPMLMRDNRGALQPALFVKDIQYRCKQNASQAVSPLQDLKDGTVVIGRQSIELLEKIKSKYYESLLRSKGVDPRDEDDIKICILADQGASQSLRGIHSAEFPFKLTLHGQPISITDSDRHRFSPSDWNDSDSLHSSGLAHLNRLFESGKFVEAVAGGGDAAREVERILVRAKRCISARWIATYRRDAEEYEYYISSFLEHAPVLDRVELIQLMELVEYRQRLPILMNCLFSEQSKTFEVEVEIALEISKELRHLTDEKQIEVLDYLNRRAPEMSAVDKDRLLGILVSSVKEDKDRRWMPLATSLSCRRLCNTLAASAGEFPPCNLRKSAMELITMCYDALDETKTWALSLLDKLSRGMAAVPMIDTDDISADLAKNIKMFSSTEHQSAVAEILERLLNNSDFIFNVSRDEIIRSLDDAMGERIIDDDLAPRFKAVKARVMQMEVFKMRRQGEISE